MAMLREAESKRNKGQAKVWDSHCLRTLGVASMNDMSPAPMDRRSCPVLGVGTVFEGDGREVIGTGGSQLTYLV